MLNRFPIHHICNGIDTETYHPMDREKCKSLLGIPTGKKVLMFGAPDFHDTRKGGDLLIKALQRLPESLKREVFLLTMGDDSEAVSDVAELTRLHLGYVESDRLKAIAYSAADLFVFPTRADNLPVVLQESMACGTPIVSFNVGGVPEMVTPRVTGYLAKSGDDREFATGIVEVLEDDQTRLRMSQQCRTFAVENYSLEKQVRGYMELYEQLLRKQ
jgi:glycosyltransferase involved in cell wall biosynthesis